MTVGPDDEESYREMRPEPFCRAPHEACVMMSDCYAYKACQYERASDVQPAIAVVTVKDLVRENRPGLPSIAPGCLESLFIWAILTVIGALIFFR